MKPDFDHIVDRKNTNSLKWDFIVERRYPADVLPLWVADMDFPAPAAVLDALHSRVDHGILGYSDAKSEYYEAVSDWFLRRFGWATEPEWLVKTPGVVFALSMAVQAFTQEKEAVLIQPPVYAPFFTAARYNGRNVVENRLVYRSGRYAINFVDFERKIAQENVRLFLLCSPHNPVGRVWTRGELARMGEICRRYGVIVVSDEIHCDFTLPGHPHTVFPDACPDLLERCVVCTAPSKTFNLAGLQTSNIWIPDETLRRRFQAEMRRSGISLVNALGLTACEAAYRDGEEWLEACQAYLRENLDYVREFLRKHIPEIRLVEPEGTYFAWLDCTGLGLDGQGLEDLIVYKAGLWLDAGRIFGGGADSFQRVVLACPRATLKEALLRLESAVRDHRIEETGSPFPGPIRRRF